MLIWGIALATIAELASLTAPAPAGAGTAARASVSQLPAGEAAGGVAVQHPAAGSPGEADGPLLTVKPPATIAHEESIHVPTIASGSVELQLKMLNAEAKEYTAGEIIAAFKNTALNMRWCRLPCSRLSSATCCRCCRAGARLGLEGAV